MTRTPPSVVMHMQWNQRKALYVLHMRQTGEASLVRTRNHGDSVGESLQVALITRHSSAPPTPVINRNLGKTQGHRSYSGC